MNLSLEEKQIVSSNSSSEVIKIARPLSFLPGRPELVSFDNRTRTSMSMSTNTALFDLGIDDVDSSSTPWSSRRIHGLCLWFCGSVYFYAMGWQTCSSADFSELSCDWAASVSGAALLTLLGNTFRVPSNLRKWILLLFLRTCEMLQQLILATRLQHEKTSRVTNMTCTSMVFAVIFD